MYVAEGGSILGPLRASRVLVAEGGKAMGVIRASEVQIGGALNGAVLAFRRVSILKSGSVRGAILTTGEATFSVELGGHFTGMARDMGKSFLMPVLPERGDGAPSDSVPTLAHPTDVSGTSQEQDGTLPNKRPKEEQTAVSMRKPPSGDGLPSPSQSSEKREPDSEEQENDSEGAEDFGVDW